MEISLQLHTSVTLLIKCLTK